MPAVRGWLCLLVLAALLSSPAFGEDAASRKDPAGTDLLGNLSFGSRKEPVDIRADHLDSEYKTRSFAFRGSVHVQQGDLKLQCDRLSIKLDEMAKAQVREVVAEGNVKVVQGERSASGGRAVFDQTKRTVVLSQKAELHDGPTEFEADTVTCYLDEERCQAEGSVRVKIPPQIGEKDGDAPTEARQ